MAEETEILLDSKLLSLTVPDLVKFALYVKVDKKKVDGQNKLKVIKAIRTELENNLESIEGSDSDGQRKEYLLSLLKFLDENVTLVNDTSVVPEPGPSETENEIEKLENELKLIELKHKAVQEQLLKTKQPGKLPGSSGNNPIVIEPKQTPLLGLNTSLSSTILHRDFKIQGVIGEVGQKDKLGYQALMSQVEVGDRKSVV